MRVVDIIIKKRTGLKLNKAEINYIINGYVNKEIPDYQISAFLMAIVFNPLDDEELFYLTKAMLESGDIIDLSSINGICCDKHSTGGVGDKTTLIIAPIIASCNLKIAKMSGRGLGHTGGTLDKLEAIPGFKINIKSEDFIKQVNEIGLSVVGQTLNIAPADKLLYSLRDVTGTVDSICLIASSIMSKKLASGASNILLDVKVGDGAFMKTVEDARKLALKMVEIGKRFNKKVVCLLTNMNEPLGYAIGNSLEVIEAIETLKGKGPKDLREVCFNICFEILKMSGYQGDIEKLIKSVVEDGAALNKLKEMINYQGGNSLVVDDYSLFGQAKYKIEIEAKQNGYLKSVKAYQIGHACMILGAGRKEKNDIIDYNVGLELFIKKGDKLEEGQLIGYLYANNSNYQESLDLIYASLVVSEEFVSKENIILGIVNG